jgi:formylglycine-generating enzyme required for sulfatase activity
MTQEANKTGKELERRAADTYRHMGAREVEHDVPMAGDQVDVYEEPQAEPAEPLPTLSPDVPATICIPAGPFWIGSLSDDPDAHGNETPRREVNLPAYEISRCPVTNAEYACFLADNPDYPVPYSNEERAHPYNWDSQTRIYPEGKADHPVVLVSWEDAMAYCCWLTGVTGRSYRLPTEKEWEKAARGSLPDARRYPWGNEWQSSACNARELGRNGTTSVYEFERINQSPFGVVDMVGNVWEWTASWYERYPGCPHESPKYGRVYRVVRGGSWRSRREDARVSCRGRYEPRAQRPYLGFRVMSEVRIQGAGAGSRDEASRRVDQANAGVQAGIPREEMPGVMVDRIRLRQNLTRYFGKEELCTLCFDLGVDYENFPEAKGGIVRELITYLERCGRISELLQACKQRRPNVPW